MATVQDLVRAAAARYGVDPAVALALAQRESSFQQSAISSAGAIGVMQLMPGTAAGLGVDPHDVAQNIDGGVRYLAELYSQFGNYSDALAAYNAGPGNVVSGRVPSSTWAYVSDILHKLAPHWGGIADTPMSASQDGGAGPLLPGADLFAAAPETEPANELSAGVTVAVGVGLAAAGWIIYRFL